MTCIVGGDLGISKEEKKRLDFPFVLGRYFKSWKSISLE